ncbi:MAG: sialate O-acetylesterase, partial [Flavisolibacter sp.]|nr:sialate O-acetylesterase [Flavisolibacter sp.]
MKNRFLLCFFLTIIACTAKVFAIIRLPPIMSSNMVLQQNSQATLWGWADPSERFTIACSWKNTVDSVTAFNSGKWKAKVSTPSAGGPYT